MSYTLSTDIFGFINCKPEGAKLEFRAYCPTREEEFGDSSFVQIRVQVVIDGETTPIGWYNADIYERVEFIDSGEVSSFDEPQYAEDSVWAVEHHDGRHSVVICFEKYTDDELLQLSKYEEHRAIILDMCRAQVCKFVSGSKNIPVNQR